MHNANSSLPSAAMAVSLLALVFALGGTGYAATELHRSKQPTAHETKVFKELAKEVTVANAKNSKKLDGSKAGAFEEKSHLMFATIATGASPTILHGQGAISVVNLNPPSGGEYAVSFNRPIANCTWVASAGSGSSQNSDAVLAVVRAQDLPAHPNTIQVNLFTSFSDTEYVGQGFHVIVACP